MKLVEYYTCYNIHCMYLYRNYIKQVYNENNCYIFKNINDTHNMHQIVLIYPI